MLGPAVALRAPVCGGTTADLGVPGGPPGHPPTLSPSEGKGQKWQKPARHLRHETIVLSVHLAKHQHAANGLAETC